MRVAFDARYLDGGGSGIGCYTRNLLRALLDEDPALELLLIRGRRNASPLVPGGSDRVRELVFPFPPNSPLTRWGLTPLLAPHHFDVYHAPFEVLPAALQRPRVVTVHDAMWLINPRLNSTSWLLRWTAGTFYRTATVNALAAAARVLAVSQATRSALLEHSPWLLAKLRVTPNGIDREKVRPLDSAVAFARLARWVPPGTPFVLTVGHASPSKNHLNAVRGFLEAFADRPDYRMLLVRRFRRWDPALRRLLATAPARRQVQVIPEVSDDELNALYHAARIYLHPSYAEGFGIPLLEAMAAGTPVVSSLTSSLPEVAGDAALLVDPADPRAIAAALRRLEDDGALRARICAAGTRRLERFTWTACARATLAAYHEIA